MTTPELPRTQVVIPPESTQATVTLKTGDDLQAAINAAKLGDTIMLQAGSTFTGNFLLPYKKGADWITIRSTGQLQPGRRARPSDAPVMAKLVTPNGNPAIWCVDPAAPHNYRFIGIEVTQATDTPCWNLVLINSPNLAAAVGFPTDIILDRMWIHGSPTSETVRGVWLGGLRLAVIDLYIDEIHSTFAESQAVFMLGGPGPYKLRNNRFEAAGENLFIGAMDTVADPSMMPCDIEILKNYLYKPTAWWDRQKAHEAWVAKPVGPEPPIPWTIKNSRETKAGVRIREEGNIYENCWPHGQNGTGVLFTPRSAGNLNPWAEVSEVTFRYNIIRRVFTGFSGGGLDEYCTITACVPSKNILIEDCLLEELDSQYQDYGWLGQFRSYNNLEINHVTAVNKDPARLSTTVMIGDTKLPMKGFVLTNNISKGGFQTDGMGGQGALPLVAPDGVVTGDLLVGCRPQDYDTLPGNGFPADWDAVGFVDLAGGDYHLAPTSPYKGQASDGTDPGCDIDALMLAVAGVETGDAPTPPPVNPATALLDRIDADAKDILDCTAKLRGLKP